ncbi:hypothetical protein [Chryseobacterium vrystaatense]|uniref:Carboxypeptidase regulatory-like domain-containing protein n=1 Tax=Chryseobacterium vrystaatense TaxID=307480 RepID=A0A1M4UJG6_9FLAO|nr:hypothetical protein [Chryseobacterium vrystaatense]KFF28240.1 hypothetical protein IW16_03230 [Chryseobacterium vrystaatense]SHE56847.1 hypothetical protein SAMN02787073_0654 [Chryseobacterium vrystaatense]
MKKISTLLLLVFTFILTQAQNTYYPQAFFDKKLAREMLSFGNSTIEGVASTKQKGKFGIKPLIGGRHYAPKGTVVMLFPVTPYFEEFYSMRRKYENKKTTVYMSEDAFKYKLEALTDDYGRFKFEKLKPGKYYLETIVNFTATGSYQEQTGRTDSYNVYGGYLYSSPIYQTFFYGYSAANRESEFVEVKQDGEIKEINL